MKKKNIYNKQILNLWRNPKNFGELKNPTHEYSEANTICGDEMWIHLNVENEIKRINNKLDMVINLLNSKFK